MKNKKIKICGMNYTIKVVNSYDDVLLLKGSYRCGVTSRSEETIYMANDLNNEMFKRVLLHEITHVYIYASGMAQVEWQEENVADFIEAHMLDIYTTYKKIIKDLLEE